MLSNYTGVSYRAQLPKESPGLKARFDAILRYFGRILRREGLLGGGGSLGALPGALSGAPGIAITRLSSKAQGACLT